MALLHHLDDKLSGIHQIFILLATGFCCFVGGLSHLSHSVATSRRSFRTNIWNRPEIAVTLHRG